MAENPDDQVLRTVVLKGEVRHLLDDYATRMAAAGVRHLMRDEDSLPSRGRILPRELRELACDVLGTLGMPLLVETLVDRNQARTVQLDAVRVLVALGPGARTGKDDVGEDDVPGVVLLPEADEPPAPPPVAVDEERGRTTRPVSDGRARAAKLAAMLKSKP